MKTNWAKITDRMAGLYGYTTAKGDALLTISCLCKKADEGAVSYTPGVGITGQIPSCTEYGTDFSVEGMRSKLLGLAAKHPGLCHVLVTHDLNSFTIERLGELVTEIRLQ